MLSSRLALERLTGLTRPTLQVASVVLGVGSVGGPAQASEATPVIDFACVAQSARSCGFYVAPSGITGSSAHGGVGFESWTIRLTPNAGLLQAPVSLQLGELATATLVSPVSRQGLVSDRANALCLSVLLAKPPAQCVKPMYSKEQVDAVVRAEQNSTRQWTRERMKDMCLALGQSPQACETAVPAADKAP